MSGPCGDSGCYAIVPKETGHPAGQIKFQKDLCRRGVDSLSIGYELARPIGAGAI